MTGYKVHVCTEGTSNVNKRSDCMHGATVEHVFTVRKTLRDSNYILKPISVNWSPFCYRRIRSSGCVVNKGGEVHTGCWCGKSEGNRQLGRLRRRWKDNFKIDLQEKRWSGMDWIDLAQDRNKWRALMNRVMKPGIP